MDEQNVPETDPEIIKKRIAEMQQMHERVISRYTREQRDQAPKPDPANPPYQSELTVIWKEEKQILHDRLDQQARVIEQLSQRIMTLEAWAIQLQPPTVFTDLYRRDRTAWDAPKPKQTLGAGIGQAIPARKSTAVRLPPEATEGHGPKD